MHQLPLPKQQMGAPYLFAFQSYSNVSNQDYMNFSDEVETFVPYLTKPIVKPPGTMQ